VSSTSTGYYESQYARPWYRFTRPATLWLLRMTALHKIDTYRWDGTLGLPWADFNNPTLIDLGAAKAYWRQRGADGP
jgi:hypothetical protein